MLTTRKWFSIYSLVRTNQAKALLFCCINANMNKIKQISAISVYFLFISACVSHSHSPSIPPNKLVIAYSFVWTTDLVRALCLFLLCQRLSYRKLTRYNVMKPARYSQVNISWERKNTTAAPTETTWISSFNAKLNTILQCYFHQKSVPR